LMGDDFIEVEAEVVPERVTDAPEATH